MKIMSVVGARPQFVKLAPISWAASEMGIEHIIVHSGQHYDPLLSDSVFQDLEIPPPNVNLEVGSGSHGRQTGAILAELDAVYEQYSPDWVLAYGDTNTTLAAAVAAVKLHYPLAHLEAGLRSFNRRMPEEHNRVLTDHAADLLLAPTEIAMEHLSAEGLSAKSVLVGDVMTDVLLRVRDRILEQNTRQPGQLILGQNQGDYYVATIHRAENTDNPTRLSQIVTALSSLDKPVMLLAHPRLVNKAAEFGIALEKGAIRLNSPLRYPELVAATIGSAGVITDSGGLQKEAFLLRVPCTTVRSETEWTETLAEGWNVLVDNPPHIPAAVTRPTPTPTAAQPYGDGKAAVRAISALINHAQ